MKKQRGSILKGGLVVLIAVMLFMPAVLYAGSLDNTSAPVHTMKTIDQVYGKLVNICKALAEPNTECYSAGDGVCDSDLGETGGTDCPGPAFQKGSLTPPSGAAASTMKTLEQIYTKLVKICAKATGTEACTYTADDGVCDTALGECGGTDCPSNPCTGAVCGDGTCNGTETIAGTTACTQDCTTRWRTVSSTEIRDNSTALIWYKSPDTTVRNWDTATAYCPTIGTGWRLPTKDELSGLIDRTGLTCTDEFGDACTPSPYPASNSCYACLGPALPSGHPFTNVQGGVSIFYWTSTEGSNSTNSWCVNFNRGTAFETCVKTGTSYTWCVK